MHKKYAIINQTPRLASGVLPQNIKIFRISENQRFSGFRIIFVDTNAAAGGFAAEFDGAVKSLKENVKERKAYMSLAMEIQEYIEKEKDAWRAEGRAEGEAKANRKVASRLLKLGLAMEQIAEATGMPAEEVRKLCQEK